MTSSTTPDTHQHNLRFDGDDPYVICECGYRADAISGKEIKPRAATPNKKQELREKIENITQDMFVALSDWQAGGDTDWHTAKVSGRAELEKLFSDTLSDVILEAERSFPAEKTYDRNASDERFAGAAAFNTALRRCKETTEKKRREWLKYE